MANQNYKIDDEDETDTPANSNKKPRPGTAGGVTPGILKQYIERIEKLEESKSSIAADIREVYAEAKGNGFDPKTMRSLLKIRKLEPEQRAEQEELLELYLHALGMN
ncbi:MAG: DUF2312 domain-containing protein [Alphaproteobacteria bacterium]|nr:MAG: DUF2312 domain-containing protein [Alphaproteobacteria bacterium]